MDVASASEMEAFAARVHGRIEAVDLLMNNAGVGIGGPFQTEESDAVPSSADVPEKAKLPIFWGDPLLQGLHVGVFVALYLAAAGAFRRAARGA